MNNFKKCPIKKRPVVYEVEDDVQIIEDVPQDLSLKRKAEDECSSSSDAKKNNFALNLSSNSFYDKMQQQANTTSVWFIEDTTRRPESPVSPSSDSSIRRETSVSPPVAGPEYNNIHLRGLTSVQRNQSESLINHYGMNYYWPRYQHEDGHSEISYNLTPPSSPSSSEPEDLSVKSYIPLPALLYHDIRTTYEEKSKECHRFKCEKCGKSYSTITGLSKHTQFHCPAAECNQVKKTFSCKSCDKVYTSLGALKMHIRTHTLPCKCPICGKAFSRPWLLQGHIRTHTGEKPFTCDHCHRAFADRSNLRAHQQTHVEVKKYICECCQKSFSRMSLLNKHTQGGCSVQSY